MNNSNVCNGFGTGGCPIGQYCASNVYCENTLPLGSPCTQGAYVGQCGFMADCFKNMTTLANNCILKYSILNGMQLQSDDPTWCISNYTLSVQGKIYCMPAPVSVSSYSEGVAPGTQC